MLSNDEIVYIAAQHDAVNADDSFWKDFARAIEAAVRGVSLRLDGVALTATQVNSIYEQFAAAIRGRK